MQPLFLEPIFKEMIWGGDELKKLFNYDIKSDRIGECFAISANKNYDCRIYTKQPSIYNNKTLGELWSETDIFGKHERGDIFPLLTKLISAKEDLSIQVHPDDSYAMKNEAGSLGKNECWYIVDAKEGATIIIGHVARTREELEKYIERKDFLGLVREIPIKRGDFFYIPAGTIHAIKGGTVILETQQNSDITYRLYDYDRLQNGKPRELHLKKSLDVIEVPSKKEYNQRKVIETEDYIHTILVSCDFFTVEHFKINREISLKKEDFILASLIDGELSLEKDGIIYDIKKGEHFILPSKFGKFRLFGSGELIISTK